MDNKRNRVLCPEINRRVLLFNTRERTELFIRQNYRISLARNDGQPPTPYLCKTCGGWHISSSASAAAFNYNSEDRKRERQLSELVEDFYKNFKNSEYYLWTKKLKIGYDLLQRVEMTSSNCKMLIRARKCLKEHRGAINRAEMRTLKKENKEYLTKLEENFTMLRNIVYSGRMNIALHNVEPLGELLDEGYRLGFTPEMLNKYEVFLDNLTDDRIRQALTVLYDCVKKWKGIEEADPDVDYKAAADELGKAYQEAFDAGTCDLFILNGRSVYNHFSLYAELGLKRKRDESEILESQLTTPNAYELEQIKLVRVKLALAMTAIQNNDMATAEDHLMLGSLFLEEVRPFPEKKELLKTISRLEEVMSK